MGLLQLELNVNAFILTCIGIMAIFIYLLFFRIKHRCVKLIFRTLDWLVYQQPKVVDGNLKDSLFDVWEIREQVELTKKISLKKYFKLIRKAHIRELSEAVNLSNKLQKFIPTFYTKPESEKEKHIELRNELAKSIEEDIKEFIKLAEKILMPEFMGQPQPDPEV